jgi:L-lysine 2,3-aminomutase
MFKLFERGITVRNQAVLQRGVNDDEETIKLLVKRLGHLHVHPYYLYIHDLVKGVEDLRTTLQTGLDLERHVRGVTAGFKRRPSSSTLRAAAASATRTRSPTTIARPGSASSRARASVPATGTSTSIPSTSSPRRARRDGPIRGSTRA